MSTAVVIDPQTETEQPPPYPGQEPIPLKEPYPKQDPAFQPVRMNLMPPAPVQFTSPTKHAKNRNQSSGSTPMNYLPLSICTLVMCCFPLSLFAVRNSLKVSLQLTSASEFYAFLLQ